MKYLSARTLLIHFFTGILKLGKESNFKKTDWDDLWKSDPVVPHAYEEWLERERCSARWRRMREMILKHYGSFSGIKVVEIGSGRGTVSLLMAREGALVTLLDVSEEALKQAKSMFEKAHLQAEYIQEDLLDLSREHMGKYDVSMSFGLAEHFRYPERQKVIDMHALVLKKGGLTFISVPNKWCPSFQLFKIITKVLGKWRMGLEVSFTRSELKKNIYNAGLCYITIIGSSWIADMNYFLLSNMVKLFRGMCGITGDGRRSVSRFERSSCLDAYLGYALVVVGQR